MAEQLSLFVPVSPEDAKLDAIADSIVADLDAQGFTQADKEEFLRRLQLAVTIRSLSPAERRRFLASALQAVLKLENYV